MRSRLLLCVLCPCLLLGDMGISDADAFGRRRGCSSASCAVCQVQVKATLATTTTYALQTAQDALEEVNAARIGRGLRPFLKDDALTVAARGAADFRAANLIQGHTANDFSFLPTGASADAAGCAAWSVEWGWGACCTYDAHSHAGAAFAIGTDGRRYMHIYVRGQNGQTMTVDAFQSAPRRGLFRRR